MALTAAEIWRDFEIAANPASGAHKPIKADIRVWGAQFEALGGFNAPGADATMALFSAGVGVPANYRKITGFDLPNPSDTVPGAVFAKSSVGKPGQILAGLEPDGSFSLAAVSGSGNIMLSNNPSFTGTMTNGTPAVNFIGAAGGTHIFYAPDGRLAVQLGGAGNPNFYKAENHSFYNSTGVNKFADLSQYLFALTPQPLTAALAGPALSITQTWNTTGLAQCFDLRITDTASAVGSAFMRARGGPAGLTQMWFVDKGGSGTYAGNLNIGLVVVVGTKNLVSFNGTNMDFYNVAGGTRYLDSTATKILEFLSNAGVHQFYGATSGNHSVSPPAVASGNSTWPTTSGEILNTGKGASYKFVTPNVNLNAVGDTTVAFPMPPGVARWRVSAFTIVNTGPLASLTNAQYGVFSATGGGGIAYVAAGQVLTAITQNIPGNPGCFVAGAGGTLPTYLWNNNMTLFFRVTQAQGAPASVDIHWIIEVYP